MSKNGKRFRPMEEKILGILSDGRLHPLDELRECCRPSGITALRMQIVAIRKKIRYDGYDVMFREKGYQMVRLIDNSE